MDCGVIFMVGLTFLLTKPPVSFLADVNRRKGGGVGKEEEKRGGEYKEEERRRGRGEGREGKEESRTLSEQGSTRENAVKRRDNGAVSNLALH